MSRILACALCCACTIAPGVQVPDQSVGPAELAAQAVTADKIADDAVETRALKDRAVTTAKLGEGSVETGKLGLGAVTGPKIANGAIAPAHLAAMGAGSGFDADKVDGIDASALVQKDAEGGIVVTRVGVGTSDPQSALQIEGDYLQIPISATLPPGADCDEDRELGRMLLIGAPGPAQLRICRKDGDGVGWASVSL
jgi:hypothetical protein